MTGRRWSTVLAVVLLASTAVALAANVQGQDYERRGAVEEAGGAYELSWTGDVPGTLRLSLDEAASSQATPFAKLSVFDPDGERFGTFTLDGEFPTLDLRVDDQGEHTLVVHRALGADVAVLAPEDEGLEVHEAELATEAIELVAGSHEDLARQIALDRDERPVDLSLSFEGSATGLTIEAVDDGDAPVLSADAPSIDSAADQALAPTVHPAAFEEGSLLVKVSADAFNGTLALTLSSLQEDRPNVVTLASEDSNTTEDEDSNTTAEDRNGTEEDEPSETNRTGPDGNTTHDRIPADWTRVTDLEPGTPVAFEVPAGVDRVVVVGEEDCGRATLFDPDDAVVGHAEIDEEHGHGSDDEGHDDADRGVAEIPVSATGEHVIVLQDTYENATLALPAPDLAVEHRTLETEIVNGSVETDSDGSLFAEESGSAEAAIEGGLLGFSWSVEDGADAYRSVELVSPGNETVYEAQGTGAYGLQVQESDGSELAGPSGTYTVHTEGDGLAGGDLAFELTAYVR